jgi:hypothetical protein
MSAWNEPKRHRSCTPEHYANIAFYTSAPRCARAPNSNKWRAVSWKNFGGF